MENRYDPAGQRGNFVVTLLGEAGMIASAGRASIVKAGFLARESCL